jgi:hypothetical protein
LVTSLSDESARPGVLNPTRPLDRGRVVFRYQVGVTHRHLNCTVPRELGDSVNIDSGHYKSGSKSVPVAVPGVVGQASFVDCWLEPVSGGAEASSLGVAEAKNRDCRGTRRCRIIVLSTPRPDNRLMLSVSYA